MTRNVGVSDISFSSGGGSDTETKYFSLCGNTYKSEISKPISKKFLSEKFKLDFKYE
jgi:hypothetical protein